MTASDPRVGEIQARLSAAEPCTMQAGLDVWGACGVEGCIECRPLFDSDNNPIVGTDQ